MRLFKRPSTSPQLVSATPILQDGTRSPDDKVASVEESSMRVDVVEPSPKPENDVTSEMPGTCARKGISTWGRKVGRRWDQLKRSDSAELLSVSGRRRRWSPNRKSLCDTNDPQDKHQSRTELSAGFVKRISRVESLRNLFRTSERGCRNNTNGETSKRAGVAIEEEEDDDLVDLSHYKMEKAVSEGALRNVMDPRLLSELRNVTLVERKMQLGKSIQNLEEQQRVYDYILNNQEMMKSEEGMSLVRDTLSKSRTDVRRDSTEEGSNKVEFVESEASKKIRNSGKTRKVRRILFNGGDNEGNEQRRTFNRSALEDLMCTLRLGCDESGYDSDSTRAGADSPDSEQALPTMLKPRSFSVTSDDYQGTNLSMIRQKNNSTTIVKPMEMISNRDNIEKNERSIDDTDENSNSTFNESIKTDTTLMSEDDDTDSCDESTFVELPPTSCFYQKNENVSLKNDPAVSRERKIFQSTENIDETAMTRENISRTPVKLVNPINVDTIPLGQRVRVKNLQKLTRSQQIMLKGRKGGNDSVLNLLENAASPCKDSPPAAKISSQLGFDNGVRYYSPKRSRSRMESGSSPEGGAAKSLKRPVFVGTPMSKNRRELRTIKLEVDRPGKLGIRVEKREAVRAFYVVAKLEENGEAERSKLIRVGDEIVRICGRRLRGMSFVEARNALRSSIGTVELQIARETMLNFDGELGDTWGEPQSRGHPVVWSLPSDDDSIVKSTNQKPQNDKKNRCEIVAALTKSGKSLSLNNVADKGLKITGMRKFQVMRKRNSMPDREYRRTASLTMDMLTVSLEKGSTKKLGFSIVGGSDSNKGSMGIFVKEVMNGGQAAEEGTLRAGDEILAINGQLMEGLTHSKALQLFKVAKPGVLILHVARRHKTHKRFLNGRL